MFTAQHYVPLQQGHHAFQKPAHLGHRAGRCSMCGPSFLYGAAVGSAFKRAGRSEGHLECPAHVCEHQDTHVLWY